MRRFWKREQEFSDLEAELRARRAEPPAQFVRALADRVVSERSWSRPRLRSALTVALVLLGAVAFASAGGVGLAASGPEQLVQIVDDLTSSSSSPETADSESPADDQYKPGKGCGDKNHEHKPKEGTGSADPTKPCPVQAGSKKAPEGNSGLTAFDFTISIGDGLEPVDAVAVAYTTQDGTATLLGADYVGPVAGVVTFAPGETKKTVTIDVVGDSIKESDETFILHLYEPSENATIVEDTGVGTVVNDD
jgi:Calx-beta domain